MDMARTVRNLLHAEQRKCLYCSVYSIDPFVSVVRRLIHFVFDYFLIKKAVQTRSSFICSLVAFAYFSLLLPCPSQVLERVVFVLCRPLPFPPAFSFLIVESIFSIYSPNCFLRRPQRGVRAYPHPGVPKCANQLFYHNKQIKVSVHNVLTM
jgi:hypothetical protein